MRKTQLPFIIIFLLTILLIAWVIWTYEKRIQTIDSKIKNSPITNRIQPKITKTHDHETNSFSSSTCSDLSFPSYHYNLY